jgi:hypothetical protein
LFEASYPTFVWNKTSLLTDTLVEAQLPSQEIRMSGGGHLEMQITLTRGLVAATCVTRASNGYVRLGRLRAVEQRNYDKLRLGAGAHASLHWKWCSG